MFVLLNGSFGIGKTTTATLLARELSNASVYDPELVGYVLRRLPSWLLGHPKQPDDFQDIWLWRRLIVSGARRALKQSSIVIVPMAFTNLTYLDDFTDALGARAPVLKLCLVAPLTIVQARLRARAQAENSEVSEWQMRRSRECCDAHASELFGQPIDAARGLLDIVGEIRRLIERP